MKRLAIIFPGWRHSADRALLYYPEKMLRQSGFETLLLHYDAPRDGKKESFTPEEALKEAWEQVKRRLDSVDFSQYDAFVFVSKSMGTVLAGQTEEQYHLKEVCQIFLTPIRETFPYFKEKNQMAVAGAEDKMVDVSLLKEECERHHLPLTLISGVGHNLEADSMEETFHILGEILKREEEFLIRFREA